MGARVGYSPAWVHNLAPDGGTSMLRNYKRAPLSWNSLWIHHGFVCPWSQESLQPIARTQPLAASDQPPRRHLPGKHAAQSSPRPKNSAESIAVVLVKQILRIVCSAARRDMNSIMETPSHNSGRTLVVRRGTPRNLCKSLHTNGVYVCVECWVCCFV